MLSQEITWSTLNGGCTDFSCVLKPKIEKMGTLKKNGDPMGTQNLKKVPMATQVPKWGPAWEQCVYLGIAQIAIWPLLLRKSEHFVAQIFCRNFLKRQFWFWEWIFWQLLTSKMILRWNSDKILGKFWWNMMKIRWLSDGLHSLKKCHKQFGQRLH